MLAAGVKFGELPGWGLVSARGEQAGLLRAWILGSGLRTLCFGLWPLLSGLSFHLGCGLV